MIGKRIFRIVLIPILLLLGLFVIQITVKSKLSKALVNELPEYIQLDYERLSVNVLMGSVSLHQIKLELYSQDTLLMHTDVKAETLNLEGFGYLDFFFSNDITVRELELVKPEIHYFPAKLASNKSATDKKEVALDRKLIIDNFNIIEGKYVQMQESADDKKLEVTSFDFSLNHVVVSRETLNQKIPFSYKEPVFKANQLFLDLGPYETLNTANVAFSKQKLILKDLFIGSKYSKEKLSEMLTTERDHVNLKIPEIQFSSLDFGYNNGKYFLYIDQGELQEPNLEIYRDKLVNDDLEYKKLYSRMLRELPFNLDVEYLKIKNGYISYAERVDKMVKPGEIVFTALNADLKQISNNRKKGEETKIEITTKFMDTAPLSLDWSFDTQKENDAFLVTGELREFNSESINPFLKANLRAEANGMINELFFTFSGDAVSATGDMKMKYENFNFVVLQKNRRAVNKLLTTIGNLFTSDGSRSDAHGYRYGNIYAERDTSKSFFNYLWLNVKAGMLSTLTGNGKKD
ncbi:hypothetical protein [Arenibacter latericius]|uniref:hypothetical protein n=1 Tax=Arenibacter latericius TaxID=86104 RepID=UPI00047D27B3|nr:hypothetical protein [Arenibacter latericius]